MTNYPTKAAAIAALLAAGCKRTSDGRFYFPGRYVCAHGEYERPDYAPRKYKDGWGIHAAYYYSAGTFCAPKDGRVDLDLLTADDRARLF